jgi:putative restriction endonuclease
MAFPFVSYTIPPTIVLSWGTPDYIIQVRQDILEEEDGPVLQHGLMGLHQVNLSLPSSRSQWPSREALEWRYSRFTKVE